MKKTILSLAIIASLVSCKKDTPAPVNNCTASAASIAGSYKITAVSYKENASAAAVDMLAAIPACQQDDLITLNTDGNVTMSDAGVSCGLPPAPGSAGEWSLISDNTVLKVSDSEMKIKSFDCSTLVVEQIGDNGTADITTTTMTKQ